MLNSANNSMLPIQRGKFAQNVNAISEQYKRSIWLTVTHSMFHKGFAL